MPALALKFPPPKDDADEADDSRTRGLDVLEHAVPYKLYKLAIRGSHALRSGLQSSRGRRSRSSGFPRG